MFRSIYHMNTPFFDIYLHRLYHMKVGSMPLKGILLSVKMGFFYISSP